MQVVQTPSPCAIVARRCTWVPTTRPMASVSASHSWGFSWATSKPAMLLAQLLAHHGELPEAGRVPAGGQHLGQRLGGAQVRLPSSSGPVPLDEGHPAPGELDRDGLVPARLGEEAHCGDREVVVLLVEESRPTSVSAKTFAGRPRPRAP